MTQTDTSRTSIQGAKLIIISLGLCLACGSGSPSVKEARAALEREAAECGEGLLRIQDFRKTNGQVGKVMGLERYVMYFDADVEFIHEAFAPDYYKGWCADQVSATVSAGWRQRNIDKYAERGDIRVVSGTATFTKSEQGWLIEEIESHNISSVEVMPAGEAVFDHKLAQEKTTSEMRDIGAAIYSWAVDRVASEQHSSRPSSLRRVKPEYLEELLVPDYASEIPREDGWGNEFEFYLDESLQDRFTLIRSAGRDGVFDVDAETAISEGYQPGSFLPGDYDHDIVWTDGFFTAWPE